MQRHRRKAGDEHDFQIGIEVGRVVNVSEAANGALWGSHLFPNYLGNATAVRSSDGVLGGALQPLTLEITIGFALSTKT